MRNLGEVSGNPRIRTASLLGTPLPIGNKIEHTVTISPREQYIHGRKRIQSQFLRTN